MNKKEEIIINGVNVAGCNFYRKNNGIIAPDGTPEKTDICTSAKGFCSDIGNCYYKQLQQLKEENEELIERANAYNGMKILANCRLEKLEKIEEVITKSCDFYKNTNDCKTNGCSKNYKTCSGYKVLQIIRGEE